MMAAGPATMSSHRNQTPEEPEPAGIDVPFGRTLRKPSFPINAPLRSYLARCRRELEIPVTYARLENFQESLPLADANGRDTLWETVLYSPNEMEALKVDLKYVYALLKVHGDLSVMDHLYIDRDRLLQLRQLAAVPDPDRQQHQREPRLLLRQEGRRLARLRPGAGAPAVAQPAQLRHPRRRRWSRSTSPACRATSSSANWLDNREIKPVRIAKELVKFNERCFIRLLGDMRSYNFVFVLTPDFEGWQVRIRAMDFDQQSYHGRRTFYLPQFFKENLSLVQFCTSLLDITTSRQYQREERTLLLQRADASQQRLDLLLDAMSGDVIAPEANVITLREGLAEHFGADSYLKCESMAAIVRENLRQIGLEDQRRPANQAVGRRIK